jgi:beta-lactamase regulating signal transducer with metallopeptidase domain
MLPVSLDCLCFVSCAQCCLFLWIVFVLCLVPNDTKQRQSRETGNIGHKTQNKDNPEKQATLGTRYKTKCPMLPVSLDCLCFVSCAQYCLFLWIVFVLCLVPNVACFSGLFILDSPEHKRSPEKMVHGIQTFMITSIRRLLNLP